SRSVHCAQRSVAVSGPAIHESLVSRFSIRHAATAPLRGTVCNGRIFILDRASWGDDHLALIDIVATRIGMDLDRDALQLEFEQMVAARERNRLVRDLHDGILQTLTAANLQLKASANSADAQMQAKLESIKGILTSEQRRIREFVTVSRFSATQ